MESFELGHMEQFFSAVVLTLPRLFAIFSVVPFLSGGMITGTVRNGILLMLAIFMSPVAGDVPAASMATWVFIAGKEALIGVMLGLGFVLRPRGRP